MCVDDDPGQDSWVGQRARRLRRDSGSRQNQSRCSRSPHWIPDRHGLSDEEARALMREVAQRTCGDGTSREEAIVCIPSDLYAAPSLTHDSSRQTNVKENVETLATTRAIIETLFLFCLLQEEEGLCFTSGPRLHIIDRQDINAFSKSKLLSCTWKKGTVSVEFQTENVIL